MDETKQTLPAENGVGQESVTTGADGGIDSDAAGIADGGAVGDSAKEAVARLKAEHEQQLRQVRIDGEVRYLLARMGAKNPALAARALDLTGVQADENGVSGVEEAVRRLMGSDPYLFGFGQMTPSGHEASSGAVHGESRRDPDTLSDREYYDMLLKR